MLFSSMGFCQGELLIGVDLLLFFCFEFPTQKSFDHDTAVCYTFARYAETSTTHPPNNV
jgi:hypothetical protein